MDFVQAITVATGDQMDALKKKAIELGKDSIFGPVALAQAFVDLAKAGATVEEIIDGVAEASVNLAIAADEPIQLVGENLINIMNTFQLGAEDAVRVADMLAGAANASSVELMDLVFSLRYAGPVAAALGIEISDVNDALTLLGKVGIKGSTAGTSLRMIMLRLGGDIPKASDAMKELGIITEDGTNRFFDAEGKAKSLAEVFTILQEATAGLTEKETVSKLNDMFGLRAVPAALELLKQGAEGFAEINEEINRTTAADVAAARMDNLDGALKRFKATLEAVLLGPSGPFQKMLQNIVEFGTRVLKFFDSMPGPLKTFILGAIGVIGVLSILSGVFLLTIGNIVRMVRVFAELSSLGVKLVPMLGKLTTAFFRFGLALLTNPVFLIIAAIVALAVAFYLLYTRVEGFRKFIDGVWQSIQKIWDSVLNFVKKIPEYIGQAWDWVKRKTDEIWDAVFAKIDGVIGGIIDFFQRLPGRVVGALSDFKNFVVEKFQEVLTAVVGFFKDLPGRVAGFFGDVAKAVGDALVKLPGQVGYLLGLVIGKFIRFHIDVIKAVIGVGVAIVTTLIRVISKLPGQVTKILTAVISAIGRFAVRAYNKATEVGGKIVSGIIDFVSKLPARLAEKFVQAITMMVTFVPLFLAKAWEIGTAILNGIVDFVTGIPGFLLGIFTSALGTVTSFIGSFLSAAASIGSSIVSGIIDGITALPDLVWDILQKVIDSFLGLVQKAWDAAKNFASSLWNGFKEGLGISSPSFIEEALYGIQDEAAYTQKMLAKTAGRMGLLGNRIASSLDSGSLGLATPAAVAAGQGMTFNAPLIGNATIRSDQDIVALARELDNVRAQRERGRGR